MNQIYRSVQHRDELYMMIIEALEDLEDELEELEEQLYGKVATMKKRMKKGNLILNLSNKNSIGVLWLWIC